MAEQADNDGDAQGASHEPRECMACRGTGRVISNLGGEPKSVSCPWCEGSGTRVPGIDAQAGWPQNDQPEAAGAGPIPADGGAGTAGEAPSHDDADAPAAGGSEATSGDG